MLAVQDDGPGMPRRSAETAFERFTRGDSSRTRASGGAGLGLSLVQAITAAHGGDVAVAVATRPHALRGAAAPARPVALHRWLTD